MSLRLALFCAAGAAIIAGCAEPTAPIARPAQLNASALAGASTAPEITSDCTFDAGTLTCVYVDVVYQTSTHTAVSGCLYGPTGLPGRRERVFEDTYKLTAVTTTLRHGYAGSLYNVSTTVTRTLESSVQISDTCSPI